MNTNLARVLLSRGIISRGAVIQAYRNVRGLSCKRDSRVVGSFIVNQARLIGGKRIIFDTIDQEQASYAVPSEQVIMVDGMTINRLASSHNLSLEGVEITGRLRRGRAKNFSALRRPL